MNAQRLETVYTTDGNSYEGYISEQIPGESMSVYSQRTHLRFAKKSIEQERVEYRAYQDMNASARDFFAQRGDTTLIKLYSFVADGVYYDDAYRVYKDGLSRDTAEYLFLSAHTYKLDWNKVMTVVKTLPEEIPYGLKDRVLLKRGGDYHGFVVRQRVGQSLTLHLENGSRKTFKMNEIMSISSEKKNEAPYLEQSVLVDRVILKDSKTSLEGFITSRVLGECVYLAPVNGGEEKQIPVKDIACYQRYVNPGYRPYEEAVDTLVSFVMDGKSCELTPVEMDESHTRIYVGDAEPYVIGTRYCTLFLHNLGSESTMKIYTVKSYFSKMKWINGFATDDKPYQALHVSCAGHDLSTGFQISTPGFYYISIDKDYRGVYIKVVEDL